MSNVAEQISDESEAFRCEVCEEWRDDSEAHEIHNGYVCDECLNYVDRCNYCKESFLSDDLAVIDFSNGVTALCCKDCDPEEKQEFENKDFQ